MIIIGSSVKEGTGSCEVEFGPMMVSAGKCIPEDGGVMLSITSESAGFQVRSTFKLFF